MSATFTIDNGWKWVTVTKTYTAVGAYPRLFYTWDGGGVPFQVYGAQIADVTDSQYAGSVAGYLAPTPETFSYDEDGNLTGDGHSTYLYDAENRLIWLQTAATAASASEPMVACRYYYDYLGRRVIKLDYTWNGTTWVQGAYDVHVYRGWNLIHTKSVSAANVTTLKNYFWGLDLSGTEQGAGGVGGLLVVQEGNNSYLPLYDALGNVHGMITAASVTFGGTSYPAGSLVAEYEYDGFGKTLRESGPYAAANRIRYSTKYTDAESGLMYYGMRHYSPTLGRFINKDPIQERGGVNLYSFCSNNAVNKYDILGMRQAYWGDDGVNEVPDQFYRKYWEPMNPTVSGPSMGDILDLIEKQYAERSITITVRSRDYETDGQTANPISRSSWGSSGTSNSSDWIDYLQSADGNSTATAPNSLAGVRLSNPSSHAVDPTMGADLLDVTESGLIHDGGSAYSVQRTFAVVNPTSGGYIMQHVVRNGGQEEYWEVWPVTLSGNTVSYQMGRSDSVTFSNTSSYALNNTQTVSLNAVWMPGYTLNPNDGWSSGGVSQSGDLMMTTRQPTGWPSGGDNFTASGYVRLRQPDSSYYLPRNVEAGWVGANGPTISTNVLPPLGPPRG